MSWVFCSRLSRQSTNLMGDILLIEATGRAYTSTDGIGSVGHGGCIALDEENPHGARPGNEYELRFALEDGTEA